MKHIFLIIYLSIIAFSNENTMELSNESHTVLKNVSMLEQNISINGAIESKDFTKINSIYFDIYNHLDERIWLKIKVKNSSKEDLQKSIIFFWKNVDLSIYYVQENSVIYEKTAKNGILDGVFESDFNLLKNETMDIYVKVKGKELLPLFSSGVIVNQKEKERTILNEIILYDNGFFTGLIIAITLYSIVLFFSTKIISYMYFSLFLVFILGSISNLPVFLIDFFKIDIFYNHTFESIVALPLTDITLALFTKTFFNIKRNNKIAYFFIILFILANVFIIILQSIFAPTILPHYPSLFLPIFIFISFSFFKKSKIISSLYILGIISYGISPFMLNLGEILEVQSNYDFISSFQIGSSFCAIFISLSTYVNLHSIILNQLMYEKNINQQSRLSIMGEMVSVIAHQWRQPLNNISSILINLEVQSSVKKLTHDILSNKIENINSQLTYMSETINDFLNFSASKKNIQTFTLKDALDHALFLTKISIDKQNIKIVQNVKNDNPITTCKNEFTHVLTILLTNAKDAFKGLNKRKVIVVTINDKTLSIQDNAGGIDPKIIDKIFDPYFSTKKSKNGTGLGLYTAKMIIEQNMKGTLSVKNKKKGAAFYINLNTD